MLYNMKKAMINKSLINRKKIVQKAREIRYYSLEVRCTYYEHKKGNTILMVEIYLHVHAEELMVSMFEKMIKGVSVWSPPLSDKQRVTAW